jgi:hypothetical protein
MEISCGLVRTSRIVRIFGIVGPSVSIHSYKTGSSVVHSASVMPQLDISISDSNSVYSSVLSPQVGLVVAGPAVCFAYAMRIYSGGSGLSM